MSARQSDIITRLEQGRDEVAAFYRGLSAAQLERAVYADGAMWRVRQVLAHLLTIERSMHHLFRGILADGPGDTGEFDIERYNRSQPQKYDDMPLDEVIAGFIEVRDATIGMVQAMTDADLDREGNHPFHGHGTLERFVRWAYEHAALHLDDVRRALNS